MRNRVFQVLAWMAGAFVGATALAEDWPMWGRTPDRMMSTPEKGVPTDWDVQTGKNIRWTAQLGSQSYGNPVVAGGLVVVGTNNEARRDPRYTADGGVLKVFRESDGKFLWQQYSPKLKSGRVNDWPYQGICSTPLIEGDRLWYCTNRCEVVCLDISPLRRGESEARELWRVDMMDKLGVFPHNMTSSSIVAHEHLIYVITGNGVDDTHKNIPAPKAPAIVAFHKNTGAVVWHDNAPGENILHGQWASPAVAVINGQPQVIAPLGDSWVYSYEALTGRLIWKFDTNRKDTVYPTTRNELIATPVIWDNKMYIANGQDPEHGEGPGHLWCVDITGSGDLSLELDSRPKPKLGEARPPLAPGVIQPNPNARVPWHFHRVTTSEGTTLKSCDKMHRTISTVAIHDGLVFVPDFSGFLHCFDAKTGQRHWVYDMEAAMWGSPMIADGKVFLCDEDGDVTIFECSRELKVLATHNMGAASYCSPVFANGTLYIMTRDKLFAIGGGK